MSKPIIVIPAYVPARCLPTLVGQLTAAGRQVIVVDDGSGPASAKVFDSLRSNSRVTLLRHAVNLGKGAALRTGINYALAYYPDCPGVVTADADGQHLVDDILAVSNALETNPGHFVLSVRTFGPSVPFRSRFGNILTRTLVRGVVGQRIQDTQTGLRGIPATLGRKLLSLSAQGYEFELDMLILAKHMATPLIEIPIATVYEEGNPTSHFHPLRDSMKIYFVLFRFGLLSALTSLIDNLVFVACFSMGAQIAASQFLARGVGMTLNYVAARRAVFLSRDDHRAALPRYLLLVAGNGLISYLLLGFLNERLGTGIVVSKLLAESLLFCVSFAIQRDFVFTRRSAAAAPVATDWDSYYRAVFPVARWTRKLTARALHGAMQWRNPVAKPLSIIEFGGANSCFAAGITRTVPTAAYYAADLNRTGLEMLQQRTDLPESVSAVHADVLNPEGRLPEADVVMSVGLIEHFNPAETRTAVENHFHCCKPGGLVILSYPTPTLLYRVARFAAELVRAWRFPDERPLQRGEVYEVAARHGALLEERILWSLIFTQRIMTFRKTSASVNHA
jgi:glycosyltransferase involved in cell wall biosynthesis